MADKNKKKPYNDSVGEIQVSFDVKLRWKIPKSLTKWGAAVAFVVWSSTGLMPGGCAVRYEPAVGAVPMSEVKLGKAAPQKRIHQEGN